MSISIVRSKGQITLPREVREATRLAKGDVVEVVVTPEGILLRPRKTIDATQAWFWQPAWQAMEREAQADIEAGRVEVFKTDDDFLASFD